MEGTSWEGRRGRAVDRKWRRVGGLREGREQEEVRRRRGGRVEGERAVPSATVKFTGVCQDHSPF